MMNRLESSLVYHLSITDEKKLATCAGTWPAVLLSQPLMTSMKRHPLTILALSAAFLTANSLLAQNQPKSGSAPATKSAAAPAATTPAAAPKQQKLVKVSTLNTVEANREFQANVQLLQAQRQRALE